MQPHIHVCVDFDGTITLEDSTQKLFDMHADPAWRLVEQNWEDGLIDARECLTRQIALLSITPEDYTTFANSIEIDPAFAAFAEHCNQSGVEVTIVSDGLDRTIEAVLQKAGLDLKFRSNKLEWRDGKWHIEFPGSREGCGAYSANCKCQFAETTGDTLQVLIGDGRSDFCLAGRCDLVLAKGSLVEYCRVQLINHVPISNFTEVNQLFSKSLLPSLGRPN
jgi:2-hydroxy-3-keto-5-methylthiopentenyl-1-phosphate phosphatase